VNLRSLDLNLLLVFDAIYGESSISKAARKLHLSQPTVSNALARLRERLQDPLFERSAGGMRPTPRAKQLAEPIHQALDTLERGLRGDEVFDFAHADREFVIAVEDYGEAVILPTFMKWLAETAPNIRIRIRPESGAQLKTELREGTVDLALDYFPLLQPTYRCPCVLTEDLITLSRRGHPDLGEQLSLEQYLALPHIVLEAGANARPMIDLALSKRGLQRRIAVRVPHFISMPLMVQSTNMICTLPQRIGHLYADNFGLQAHAVPLRTPRFPVYLIWHESSHADAGHQWFRNRLIELCQQL
jgi:DNA-binding transcriptional LysR family regulator